MKDDAFNVNCDEREREVTIGYAGKHDEAVGRRVFVNLSGLAGVSLTVQRVKNMLNKDSAQEPSVPGFLRVVERYMRTAKPYCPV